MILTGPVSLLHATADFLVHALVPLDYDGYFLVDRREPSGPVVPALRRPHAPARERRGPVSRAARHLRRGDPGRRRLGVARRPRRELAVPQVHRGAPGALRDRRELPASARPTTRATPRPPRTSSRPSRRPWPGPPRPAASTSCARCSAQPKPAPGPAPRSRISKSQSLGTSWLTLEVSEWSAEIVRLDSWQALGRAGARVPDRLGTLRRRSALAADSGPGSGGRIPAMDASSPGRLERIFAAILRARWLFVVLYALLLPPAAYFALRVDQDNSLDRLIVPSDPDFIATRDFQQVFGAGEFSLLLAEVDDPFAPAVLARVDAIETRAEGGSAGSRPTPPSRSSGARRRSSSHARGRGGLPPLRDRHRPAAPAGAGRTGLPRDRAQPRGERPGRAQPDARRHRRRDRRRESAALPAAQADQARPAVRERLPRRDAARRHRSVRALRGLRGAC